jgi:hypothetical protein
MEEARQRLLQVTAESPVPVLPVPPLHVPSRHAMSTFATVDGPDQATPQSSRLSVAIPLETRPSGIPSTPIAAMPQSPLIKRLFRVIQDEKAAGGSSPPVPQGTAQRQSSLAPGHPTTRDASLGIHQGLPHVQPNPLMDNPNLMSQQTPLPGLSSGTPHTLTSRLLNSASGVGNVIGQLPGAPFVDHQPSTRHHMDHVSSMTNTLKQVPWKIGSGETASTRHPNPSNAPAMSRTTKPSGNPLANENSHLSGVPSHTGDVIPNPTAHMMHDGGLSGHAQNPNPLPLARQRSASLGSPMTSGAPGAGSHGSLPKLANVLDQLKGRASSLAPRDSLGGAIPSPSQGSSPLNHMQAPGPSPKVDPHQTRGTIPFAGENMAAQQQRVSPHDAEAPQTQTLRHTPAVVARPSPLRTRFSLAAASADTVEPGPKPPLASVAAAAVGDVRAFLHMAPSMTAEPYQEGPWEMLPGPRELEPASGSPKQAHLLESNPAAITTTRVAGTADAYTLEPARDLAIPFDASSDAARSLEQISSAGLLPNTPLQWAVPVHISTRTHLSEEGTVAGGGVSLSGTSSQVVMSGEVWCTFLSLHLQV